jgi:cob(I)alamin adenosyltransferase
VRAILVRLQHELYIAQSEIAAAPPAPPPAHRIEERHVRRIEADLDRYTATLEPLRSFVLPRGSPAGAQLHVCRAVARRAERALWSLHRESPQPAELLQWSNRLSDLLFALALSVNRSEGVGEVAPDYSV